LDANPTRGSRRTGLAQIPDGTFGNRFDDPQAAVLQELKKMGIRLAVDELRHWLFQPQISSAVSH